MESDSKANMLHERHLNKLFYVKKKKNSKVHNPKRLATSSPGSHDLEIGLYCHRG